MEVKKEILSIAVVLLIVFSLSGCGEKAGTASSVPAQMSETSASTSGISSEKTDEGLIVAPEESQTYDFTNPETVKFTLRIPEDNLYFFLLPIQNYTGDDEKRARVQSSDLDFLKDVTITAPAGKAGRTWALTDLKPGDYDFTVQGLDSGTYTAVPNVSSVVKLDSLTGTMESSQSLAYTCSYDKDTTVNFAYSGESGSAVAFFSSTDTAWMQVIGLEDGQTESEASIDFPAGDVIAYFYTGLNGSLTVK